MSNEQWLEDGDCSKCRRKNYCKKRCKRSRQAMRNLMGYLLNKAMIKKLEEENVSNSELDKAKKMMAEIEEQYETTQIIY